jgi:hypothetical protein
VSGYVALISAYIQADHGSQMRRIAIHLLQEKRDELSDFQQIRSVAGQRAYQDIVSGASHLVVSGIINTEHKFDLNWQVKRLFLQANTPSTMPNNPQQTHDQTQWPIADLKALKVTIVWIDQYDQVNSLALFCDVAPVLPRTLKEI